MNVIEVDSVSKMFRLGAHTGDLRDQFNALFAREKAAADRKAQEFWALQDISFSVAEGESFGIIGHNGSGKSTLLKLITGIYKPTTGTFRTHGRIAALIEVGAGFHPDLTGRENVYLNGSVLGMSRRDIGKKFDEIVAFAELEKFMDTPVKRYSSGMYMRLGFAIAAHIDPDIVLVDEVLAVGDESFQKKCMDKMLELRRSGKTVVFISHGMDAVAALCQRVMLLDQGKMLAIGDAEDTIRAYRDDLAERVRRREVMIKAAHNGWTVEEQEARDAEEEARRVRAAAEEAREAREAARRAAEMRPIKILGGRLLDQQGRECQTVSTHDTVYLECSYRCDEPVTQPAFGAAVVRDTDNAMICALNTKYDRIPIGPIEGAGKFGVTFPSLSLLPGKYFFAASLSHEHDMANPIDLHPRVAEVTVTAGAPETGVVLLPHTWHTGHQASQTQAARKRPESKLITSDNTETVGASF